MRKEILICDRCKKEIKELQIATAVAIGGNVNDVRTLDLCRGCQTALTDFLENFLPSTNGEGGET